MPRARQAHLNNICDVVTDRSEILAAGDNGNPLGRPKGSRNKLGERFIAALANDLRSAA
jgi:hypothetical protein